MKPGYWLFPVMLFFIGCDSSRLFEKNIELKNRVWLADDIKSFDFTIPDPDTQYSIYFNVRNTMNYPHYNIYISYQLKDSVDNILHEGLKNFNLFDPKTGAPFGQSGLGDIFDHRFLLLEEIRFDYAGSKKLELQQFMRYDSLPEIVSAGMRIERSEIN